MNKNMNTNEEKNEGQVAVGGSDELNELKEKLALVEKERDEYLNGWRRAKADMANYKNDELARLEEVIKFGNEDTIRELIPVLHSFDLALISLRDSGSVDKGIELIKQQLEEVLKRRGLERISVEVGKEFNPKTQEALLEEVSERPPGIVLGVLEEGFTLHGKVVKPARVKVSKNEAGKE